MGGRGGGVCCQTFYFVLFSLFSRPRAGLAYHSILLLLLCLMMYDIFFVLPFFWCPCMAINVSVQYDGGLLPDIILLTQCYYHT